MNDGGRHEALHGHEELKPPSERGTGLVFAAVAAILAWTLRHDGTWMALMIALSAGFAATALLKPALLGPLNRAWFRLSLALNKVVTPVVMGVLFYGLITPFGLVMRLRGADPLRQKRSGTETTWWQTREADERTDMRKQF